jgi:hypothetical protein
MPNTLKGYFRSLMHIQKASKGLFAITQVLVHATNQIGLYVKTLVTGKQRREEEVNSRGLMWIGIAFLLFAVVMQIVLWYQYKYLVFGRSKGTTVRSFVTNEPKPPEPRLQTNPAADLAAYLKKQTEQLNSYGWNDPEHKTAHVPIQRAMELAIQNNLIQTETQTQP